MCHLWAVQMRYFPTCFHVVVAMKYRYTLSLSVHLSSMSSLSPCFVTVLRHCRMDKELWKKHRGEVCPLGATSAMPQNIWPKRRWGLFPSPPHPFPLFLFLLSGFFKCSDFCETQPKCTHKTCSGRSAENEQISGVIHKLPGEMEHTVNSNWYHVHTHAAIWAAQFNYCAVLRKVCDHTVNDIEHAQGEEKIYSHILNVWLFLPSEWLMIFRMP